MIAARKCDKLVATSTVRSFRHVISEWYSVIDEDSTRNTDQWIGLLEISFISRSSRARFQRENEDFHVDASRIRIERFRSDAGSHNFFSMRTYFRSFRKANHAYQRKFVKLRDKENIPEETIPTIEERNRLVGESTGSRRIDYRAESKNRKLILRRNN